MDSDRPHAKYTLGIVVAPVSKVRTSGGPVARKRTASARRIAKRRISR
jgi:hypothetical protein